MALPTEHTEDWGFNALGPEQGVAVVEPYETLPDRPLHLLAVAPAAGLFAAAGASSIVVGALTEARAALEADRPVHARHTIQHAAPLHLAFSASEKQLFVYDAEQKISAYSTQDWQLEFASAPLKSPVKDLRAFKEKQGLVIATEDGVVVVESDGTLCTHSSDRVFTLGLNDEILTPSQPELDIGQLPNIGQPLALQCLAPGCVFLVAENSEDDAEFLTYVRQERKWLEVENTLMVPDSGAPFMWHQEAVPKWPDASTAFTSVAVSSYSSELLLVAPTAVWKPMNETDNLPFTTQDEDIIAVGGAFDLTDKTPRESLSGVEGKFPFPLWLVLTQEGRLLGWNVVCRDASKEGVNWDIPSTTDVPNLSEISVEPSSSKDIADEELDEISESDARDSTQSSLSGALNTSRPEVDTLEDNNDVSNEDSSTVADAKDSSSSTTSSSEQSREKEPTKAESKPENIADATPSNTQQAHVNKSDDDDNKSTALPKATFGSSWASQPGFGSWANSSSTGGLISKPATSDAQKGTSPFGSGNFGGTKKVESSFFGGDKARSSSPFSGFGSSSSSSLGAPKSANAFASSQKMDPFAAFRNLKQGPEAGKSDAPKNVSSAGQTPTQMHRDRSHSSSKSDNLSQTESVRTTGSQDFGAATQERSPGADAGTTAQLNDTKIEDQRGVSEEANAKTEAAANAKAEAEAHAQAKAKARAKAEAEAEADARAKAALEEAVKVEAERRAKDLIVKVESTKWIGEYGSFFRGLHDVKTAQLDELGDMDAIYAQTNSLFQLLDHNLWVLEQSSIYAAHSSAAPIDQYDQWSVGDADALRHEIDKKLTERAKNTQSSMASTFKNVSDLSAQASDLVADLGTLETSVAELNAAASDSAYQLRPLPARSAFYRRQLQARLGKIARLISAEKERVLLKRSELGETVEYANILAAIDSIDSRLYAIKEYISASTSDDFPGSTSGSDAHADAAYPDYYRGLTGSDVGGAVPTSASNVPTPRQKAMGSDHPALRRGELATTEAVLNCLKVRDANSCITSAGL